MGRSDGCQPIEGGFNQGNKGLNIPDVLPGGKGTPKDSTIPWL
jgi:hypothetical protein